MIRVHDQRAITDARAGVACAWLPDFVRACGVSDDELPLASVDSYINWGHWNQEVLMDRTGIRSRALTARQVHPVVVPWYVLKLANYCCNRYRSWVVVPEADFQDVMVILLEAALSVYIRWIC